LSNKTIANAIGSSIGCEDIVFAQIHFWNIAVKKTARCRDLTNEFLGAMNASSVALTIYCREKQSIFG
jgi:hypothetical protein